MVPPVQDEFYRTEVFRRTRITIRAAGSGAHYNRCLHPYKGSLRAINSRFFSKARTIIDPQSIGRATGPCQVALVDVFLRLVPFPSSSARPPARDCDPSLDVKTVMYLFKRDASGTL